MRFPAMDLEATGQPEFTAARGLVWLVHGRLLTIACRTLAAVRPPRGTCHASRGSAHLQSQSVSTVTQVLTRSTGHGAEGTERGRAYETVMVWRSQQCRLPAQAFPPVQQPPRSDQTHELHVSDSQQRSLHAWLDCASVSGVKPRHLMPTRSTITSTLCQGVRATYFKLQCPVVGLALRACYWRACLELGGRRRRHCSRDCPAWRRRRGARQQRGPKASGLVASSAGWRASWRRCRTQV